MRDDLHPESRLLDAARTPEAGLAPSLQRSVTFHNVPPRAGGSPYGRSDVPTAAEAERLLSALEDATSLVFASGMTAWTALCLTLLAPGKAVAIPDGGYYGFEVLTGSLFVHWGVDVRRYRAADLEAMGRAAEGASLTLVETPANPLLDVVDIAAASDAVHAGGGLLVCDNTTASPLQQRPLDLGADLTLQSGTKCLSGHSDALAGVLSTRDVELVERIRDVRSETGMVLGPDPAWLLMRGLRTLAVRVRRQSETALDLATRLAADERVPVVRYPGLPDHPQHELARRQMTGGFGGLLSFEMTTADQAEAVERALQLIHPATSLGSVESLIERRDRIEPSGRVAPGLLRMSAGLEHPDDLWTDLSQAIEIACTSD